MTAVLLGVPLALAAGATLAFWVAAVSHSGSPLHRAARRWFSRFVYAGGAAAAAGAVVELGAPARIAARSVFGVSASHLLWLLLYLLIVVVAPVQHGLAVLAAAATPPHVRSRAHLFLNLASIVGTVALFAASIVWHAWPFFLVVPAGFVVGVRNMQYASRRAASAREWELEYLTSLMTAGIALHTTLFVLAAARWPNVTGSGLWRLGPWLAPALVGLPAIVWLRGRR